MCIVHKVKMFTFIELEGFKKHLASLIVNTELGNVIQNTGGVRKLKWARTGMCKSAMSV